MAKKRTVSHTGPIRKVDPAKVARQAARRERAHAALGGLGKTAAEKLKRSPGLGIVSPTKKRKR